jgi:hypothetical protein
MLRFLVVLLMGCLVGWLVPPLEGQAPQAAPKVGTRGESWQPPALPRRPDLSLQGLALVGSPIFEPEQAVAAGRGVAGPPEDLRWRIAGTLGRGAERKVLISFRARGKSDLRLAVGQALPSGHKIVSISETGVCIEIGQGRYMLGVEYRE